MELNKYIEARDNFLLFTGPTIEQCLKYLYFTSAFNNKTVLMLNLEYIPEKHRTFCETQLKLEGLL